MARLPASLIRKYGVSKKAWQVFRSRGRSASKSTSRGTMAKKGKKKSGFFGRSSNNGVQLFQLDAMAYGAVRAPISKWAASLTAGTPLAALGNLGDEVVMGLIDYGAAKKVGGFIGDAAKKGLTVENARVGEALAQGQLMPGSASLGNNGYPV